MAKVTAKEAMTRAVNGAIRERFLNWANPDIGPDVLAALAAAGFVVVPRAAAYWAAKEDGNIEPIAEKRRRWLD